MGDNFPGIFDYEHIKYVWFICHWSALSHSAYNPVIYVLFAESFRSEFKDLFQTIIRCDNFPTNYSHSPAASKKTRTTDFTLEHDRDIQIVEFRMMDFKSRRSLNNERRQITHR